MRINYQFRTEGDSSSFRRHAEPRLQSLAKFSDRANDVKVAVSQQRNWHIVEITLDVNGVLIRSEERSDDALTSFDKALTRVERQLRKYRDKLQRKDRQTPRKMPAPTLAPVANETISQPAGEPVRPGAAARVVRTKSHALKPMSPEEAALQMELLGHNFFMFFNGESEQINVVYLRHDGDYGLIEPAVGT